MGTTTKTLYDTDFAAWAAHTAELIRARRFDELDLENLIEEVESLGRSEHHAVRSQLFRLLKHLVKQRIQPERDGSSWRASIGDARHEILLHFEDSPSLRRHLHSKLQATYKKAVESAFDETGLNPRSREFDLPTNCPCTLDELLEGTFDYLCQKLDKS